MDKQLGKVPEVILVQLEIKLLAVGFPLHQAVDPSKHSHHRTHKTSRTLPRHVHRQKSTTKHMHLQYIVK